MSIHQSGKVGETIFRIFNGILMTLVVIATLYPFWYIIVCSFSSITHIVSTPFILWPDGWQIQAYKQVFRNDLIPNAYGVTLFITLVGTSISMILTILGAFVLSRRSLPGRKYMTLLAVFTMLFKRRPCSHLSHGEQSGPYQHHLGADHSLGPQHLQHGNHAQLLPGRS